MPRVGDFGLSCELPGTSGLHHPTPTPRAPLAGKPHRRGQRHEKHRRVKHPARQIVVHDPAAQHRADGAADIEAGGHDAEHAPERARRGGGPHQHIPRRSDHARQEPRRAHRRDQEHRAEIDRADHQHQHARGAEPKRRNIAVALRFIRDEATCQHADRRG